MVNELRMRKLFSGGLSVRWEFAFFPLAVGCVYCDCCPCCKKSSFKLPDSKLDLKTAVRITPAQLVESADFLYFNLITAYMLHSLANSQSIGMLKAGFKSKKCMNKFLGQKFPALNDDEAPLPCVTRETLAYIMSLSIWSVSQCFKSDDDMFKGKAATFYGKPIKAISGIHL